MESLLIIVDDLADLTPEESVRISNVAPFQEYGSIPVFEAKGLTDLSVIRGTYEPDTILMMAPKLAAKLYHQEPLKNVLYSLRSEYFGYQLTRIIVLPKPTENQWWR